MQNTPNSKQDEVNMKYIFHDLKKQNLSSELVNIKRINMDGYKIIFEDQLINLITAGNAHNDLHLR